MNINIVGHDTRKDNKLWTKINPIAVNFALESF